MADASPSTEATGSGRPCCRPSQTSTELDAGCMSSMTVQSNSCGSGLTQPDGPFTRVVLPRSWPEVVPELPSLAHKLKRELDPVDDGANPCKTQAKVEQPLHALGRAKIHQDGT